MSLVDDAVTALDALANEAVETARAFDDASPSEREAQEAFEKEMNERIGAAHSAANSQASLALGPGAQLFGGLGVSTTNPALGAGAMTGSGGASALASLFTASEGFQAAMKPANEALQKFSNLLGSVLDPVVPLLRDLADSTAPLLDALRIMSGLLHRFTPMFQVLNVSLRSAAGAADVLSDMFINAALGLIKAVKAILPKRFEPKWLDDAYDSLKALRNAGDEAAEALGAVAGINIPPGYNFALRRWGTDEANGTSSATGGDLGLMEWAEDYLGTGGGGQSYAEWFVEQNTDDDEDSQSSSATASGMTAAHSGESARTIIIEHIDIHGVQDAESLWRELEQVSQRRGVVRNSNPLRGGMGRG